MHRHIVPDDITANAQGQRVISAVNSPYHQAGYHLILSPAVRLQRSIDPALIIGQHHTFHFRFSLIGLHAAELRHVHAHLMQNLLMRGADNRVDRFGLRLTTSLCHHLLKMFLCRG